jgi:hypothetical protein
MYYIRHWVDRPACITQVDRTANRLYIADDVGKVTAYAVLPNAVLTPINTQCQFPGCFFSGTKTRLRLALSPDRRWLLGAFDNRAAIDAWSTVTASGFLSSAVEWQVGGRPADVAVMPDSRHVAVLLGSTGDLCVYDFNTATGKPDTPQPLRCIGTGGSAARIINLGDVNNDGSEDYAVLPSTAESVMTDVTVVLGDADGPLQFGPGHQLLLINICYQRGVSAHGPG